MPTENLPASFHNDAGWAAAWDGRDIRDGPPGWLMWRQRWNKAKLQSHQNWCLRLDQTGK